MPLPTDLGGEMALLVAAPVLPDLATAGDSLSFSWVWQKLQGSQTDALALLLWLDEDGAVAAASAALPLGMAMTLLIGASVKPTVDITKLSRPRIWLQGATTWPYVR